MPGLIQGMGKCIGDGGMARARQGVPPPETIAVRCAPPWMRMLLGGARQGPCAVLPAAVSIWGRTYQFGFVGVRPAPALLPPALRVRAVGCDGGSQSVVTMSQPFPPCKSFWRSEEAKPCGTQLRVSLCSCSSSGAAFPGLSGCSDAVSSPSLDDPGPVGAAD